MSNTEVIIDFESFMKDLEVDNETMKDLYETFLEEILDEKEKLENYLEQNDHVSVGKIIHNIKGISGSYKANELYEIAKDLDIRFKNETSNKSNIQINGLFECIQVVSKEIKKYFRNVD